MGLSVIIPAFNESAEVGSVVSALQKVFSGRDDVEICVVNDGSTDETAQVSRDLGARVIHHPDCRGYGAALKTGIRHARFSTIAIIDADSTYEAADLPELLTVMDKGQTTMVIGSRTNLYRYDPLFKKLCRLAHRLLVQLLACQAIKDVNSGLRVFRRNFALTHFDRLCEGFSFTTSLTLIALATKEPVSYVEIAYRPRGGQSKFRTLPHLSGIVMALFQTALVYRPYWTTCLLIVLLAVVLALGRFV